MSLVTTDKLNSLYQQGIAPIKTKADANAADIVNLKRTATSTYAGLMSSEDKLRVDNYANIVTVNVTLRPADWVDNQDGTFTQAVNVSDLDVYNSMSTYVTPGSTAAQYQAVADADIKTIEIVNNETQVSFTGSGEIPVINLPISLAFGTSLNVVEVPVYVGDGGGSGQTDIGLSVVDGKINITYETEG